MLNDAGKTIYIGKAGSLRRRVASYFTARHDTRTFLPAILGKVADIQYLVTATESEALILENNLIKKYRPAFNIRLKDDKTYVSLKVTLNEEWPRVRIVRRHEDDGAVYFGPYASASATRDLMRLIQRVFTLCTCSPRVFRSRTRPCMHYEMGRCSAPCAGLIAREEYMKQVEGVLDFLRGRADAVRRRLKEEMDQAAADLRFEDAARLRDRIRAVERAMERQAAHEVALGDVDVFGTCAEGQHLTVQVIFVRGGRLLDAAPFHLRSPLPLAESLRSFLAQFYLAGRDVPPEIVLPAPPADQDALERLLRERRGGRVRFFLGRRGERRSLLDIAQRNAREAARGDRIRDERRQEALRELAGAFGLPAPPERIECFDISTTGGTLAVGSMTVMVAGELARDAYRHYRIRRVPGMDDFAMLAEVIERRMKDTEPLPDLLVVDGGRAQAGRAADVLAAGGHGAVKVAGLAKSRLRHGTRTAERIYVPGPDDPIPLGEEAPGSRLLQALRDEAHRFAVTYHRKLRRQRALTSGLEEVKGLGKKRIRFLFEEIGGLKELRRLSLDELRERGKLPRQVAAALHAFLHAGKEAP
jgi:excinuclease ABC subunit C